VRVRNVSNRDPNFFPTIFQGGETMNQPNKRVEVAIEKKPYEKPEIVYQAPLEATASSCPSTKNPGGGSVCDGNPYS
jgi:hypothetical protein